VAWFVPRLPLSGLYLQSEGFGFLVLLPALCGCGRFAVGWGALWLLVSSGLLSGVAGLVALPVFWSNRANLQACILVFVVAKPGFCW